MKGLVFTLLAAVIGCVIVCFSIPPLIRVAKAKQLFEPLDKRKVHKTVVPTIGGVSIFIGLTLSSFIASDGYNMSDIKYLFPAIILMFFIGLKDDLLVLPARKKLVAQMLTAIMLVTIGNIRLSSLYGVFGLWQVDYVTGAIISATLIIGFINAFNFIDGIDGLASGIGVIISTTLGICFVLMKRYDLSIVSFSLTGSLIAFFRYNVFGKENKLFMGDTGSLIIGTTLSVLALKLIETAPGSNLPILSQSAPAFCIGLMIVPIIDFLRIFFIRVWNNKSPFLPDGNHIHHKILKIYPKHLIATLIIGGANILFLLLTLVLLDQGLNINYTIGVLLFAGFTCAFLPFKIRNAIKRISADEIMDTVPD